MAEKPKAVIEMEPSTVEEVMKEFEADNPGLSSDAMTSKEFADRMWKKLTDGVKPIH